MAPRVGFKCHLNLNGLLSPPRTDMHGCPKIIWLCSPGHLKVAVDPFLRAKSKEVPCIMFMIPLAFQHNLGVFGSRVEVGWDGFDLDDSVFG